MPPDLHAFLIEEAENHDRSRNNQLISWIKEKMYEQKNKEV